MKSPDPLRIMTLSPLSQAQYNEFLREWASESTTMLRKYKPRTNRTKVTNMNEKKDNSV